MVAAKVFPPSHVGSGNVNRALALDKSDDLGDRILRRNRDQHVHMVDHQVTLLDLGLSLLGQVVKNFAQMLAKLSVQGLAAVFRDKHDVVLVVWFRLAYDFTTVSFWMSLERFTGRRLFSTSTELSNRLSPPAKPGVYRLNYFPISLRECARFVALTSGGSRC